MKRPYIILFLVSAFLLIFLLILFFLLINSKPSYPEKGQPDLTPSSQSKYPKTGSVLRITSVSPEPKYLQSISVASQIIIIFSESIDPTSLVYEITPNIKVLTGLDETVSKLSFKPIPFWKPDEEYVLTIKKAKGQKGSVLTNEYRVKFKAVVSRSEAGGKAETSSPF